MNGECARYSYLTTGKESHNQQHQKRYIHRSYFLHPLGLKPPVDRRRTNLTSKKEIRYEGCVDVHIFSIFLGILSAKG